MYLRIPMGEDRIRRLILPVVGGKVRYECPELFCRISKGIATLWIDHHATCGLLEWYWFYCLMGNSPTFKQIRKMKAFIGLPTILPFCFKIWKNAKSALSVLATALNVILTIGKQEDFHKIDENSKKNKRTLCHKAWVVWWIFSTWSIRINRQ